jgi:hypothetical protein
MSAACLETSVPVMPIVYRLRLLRHPVEAYAASAAG